MADSWRTAGAWVAGLVQAVLGYVAGKLLAKFARKPSPQPNSVETQTLDWLKSVHQELKLIHSDNLGSAATAKLELEQHTVRLVATMERVVAASEATAREVEAIKSAVSASS